MIGCYYLRRGASIIRDWSRQRNWASFVDHVLLVAAADSGAVGRRCLLWTCCQVSLDVGDRRWRSSDTGSRTTWCGSSGRARRPIQRQTAAAAAAEVCEDGERSVRVHRYWQMSVYCWVMTSRPRHGHHSRLSQTRHSINPLTPTLLPYGYSYKASCDRPG